VAKKLTPEEAAAKKAAAAEAKAAKAAAQTPVEKMSGGVVKSTPKPDAVAKGAAAMDDYASGVKPDGSYMNAAERKAAFQAAKDTRFVMPNEAATQRSIVPVQQVDRTLATVPEQTATAATAAETGAAKMAATAAKTPWYKSPKVAANVLGGGALIANEIIPRSDDSTDAGYNLNTARDVASGGLSYSMWTPAVTYLAGKVAPKLAQGPGYAKLAALGLAGLGAGTALYNRLSGYHAANPQADEQYQYALPQAKANLWEQAPAAIQDAGHLASKALRGVGDGIAYDLNNYTPWPYVKAANDAVVRYVTPPSMMSPDEPAAPAEPAAPTAQPSPETAGVQGPLPQNVTQKPDGSYQKEIYGEGGQKYGRVGGTFEQMDRLSKPSEMSLAEDRRRKVDEIIQANEWQKRVKQELDFRAATSPQAAENFFDRAHAKEELQDAINQGPTKDPIRNAEVATAIANAAQRNSDVTGEPADSFLPASRIDFPNRNAELARQILSARSKGQDVSPSEAVAQALAQQPSTTWNPRQASLEKQAAEKPSPAMAAENREVNQAAAEQRLGFEAERLTNAKKELEYAQKDAERREQDAIDRAATKQLQTEVGLQRARMTATSQLSRLNKDLVAAAQTGDVEAISRANAAIAEGQKNVQMIDTQLQSLGVEIPEQEAPATSGQEVGSNPTFNSVEEAEAANLPKGTLVTVAGRSARID
jgi:nicotinamide mononucleotide adenylyltransferase